MKQLLKTWYLLGSPRWNPHDPSHLDANPKFGTALIIPMTLSFLFAIPHWWRTEKTTKLRLLTLPLLLLQIWPQYRVVKLLISLWNDQRKYHNKKEEYDRDVSCVGKKYLLNIIVDLLVLVSCYQINSSKVKSVKNSDIMMTWKIFPSSK